jgi:hypothetical protein
MSGLVFNEKLIDRTKIKSKIITIKRCANTTLGVRVWYEILTTENEFFQRWTLLMDNTDEVLLLCQVGDTLSINYIEDIAEDAAAGTFESFTRNVILNATYVNMVD